MATADLLSRAFKPFDADATIDDDSFGVVAVATPRPAATVDEGRYEVKDVLGRGGMGEVRLCRDARIGRDVAVKVALAHAAATAEARARFLREAHVQAQLEHPNIVPVHDLEVLEDGSAYFAMKRVQGRTLADILGERRGVVDDGPVSTRRLLAAVGAVCLAVDFAHRKGVTHRDIKPANIMLGDFGEVYLLDWGIAKVRGASDQRMGTTEVEIAGTAAGAIVGTLGYMAPEQLDPSRGETGPRSDVFSLGAVLFEVATGKRFIDARDGLDAVQKTLQGTEPRPSHRGLTVHPRLDDIIGTALALEPAARFPSARALYDALDAFLTGEHDRGVRLKLAERHARDADDTLARTDDPAARANALRSLGSALAIDPDNVEVRRKLVSVLTAPLATLSPEAEARVHAAQTADRRDFSFRTAVAQAANLALVPLLIAAGVRDPWVLVGAVGLFSIAAVLNLSVARTRGARPELGYAATLMALGGYIGIARIEGTAFVVGAMLVGFATASQVHPLVTHRRLALAGSVVALLVAFVLPRALGPGVDTATGVVILSCALEITALVTSGLFVARVQVARAHAERQLIAQAWQLEQLLPPADRPRGLADAQAPVGARPDLQGLAQTRMPRG